MREPKSAETVERPIGARFFAGRRWRPRSPLSSGHRLQSSTAFCLALRISQHLYSGPISWTWSHQLENLRTHAPRMNVIVCLTQLLSTSAEKVRQKLSRRSSLRLQFPASRESCDVVAPNQFVAMLLSEASVGRKKIICSFPLTRSRFRRLITRRDALVFSILLAQIPIVQANEFDMA